MPTARPPAIFEHLQAARRMLADDSAGPDGSCIANYDDCIAQGAFDMALEELVALGRATTPPASFWKHLRQAADRMPSSPMVQSLRPEIAKHEV
jgi:hypothetical protein